MRRCVFVAALLAAFPVGAEEQVAAQPVRPIVTEKVATASESAGTFVGVVEAMTTVNVSFQVLGRLIERSAQEGDFVIKNQVLARIDSAALADDRDTAKAALVSAEAAAETAAKSLVRARELAARNVASASTLEAAQRQDASARAEVDSRRAQLAKAQDAFGYATLTAPMDGIVVRTLHDPGNVVSAGEPVVVLASPTGRKARIDLPNGILRDLAPGAPFLIETDGLTRRRVDGRLLRVDPVSLSQTRMLSAEIELGAGADALTIGQLVHVTPGSQGEPTLVVPAAAVVERDGKSFVWRVAAEAANPARRTVHLTPVIRGEAVNDTLVAIREGVAHDDEVVVRGVNSLIDGQAVGPSVILESHSTERPRIEVRDDAGDTIAPAEGTQR